MALKEIDKMSYEYICLSVRVSVNSIQVYLASHQLGPGVLVALIFMPTQVVDSLGRLSFLFYSGKRNKSTDKYTSRA